MTKNKKVLFVSGKAKPYPSEMEKVVQDEIRTSIDEITASLRDRDNTIDAEIETIRSSVASFKNALIVDIQQANVSWILPIYRTEMP